MLGMQSTVLWVLLNWMTPSEGILVMSTSSTCHDGGLDDMSEELFDHQPGPIAQSWSINVSHQHDWTAHLEDVYNLFTNINMTSQCLHVIKEFGYLLFYRVPDCFNSFCFAKD